MPNLTDGTTVTTAPGCTITVSDAGTILTSDIIQDSDIILDQLASQEVSAFAAYAQINAQTKQVKEQIRQKIWYDKLAEQSQYWKTNVADYLSGTAITAGGTSYVNYAKIQTDWATQTNACYNACYTNYITPAKPKTATERLREMLKLRHTPTIVVRGVQLVAMDAREARARETLKLVIGEEKYKGFLKHGFVSARNSQSGRVYQIFPGADYGTSFTRVYENGVLIDRLCVHLTRGFTPTDHMIVRYLMCLNNEKRLWALANKHGVGRQTAQIIKPDFRPLPEVFRELKAA